MIFICTILLPIFLKANENPSNDISNDVWFISDDKKKIICDISISSVSISSKTIFCNGTNAMIEDFHGQLGNQYELKIKGTTFSNSIQVNKTIVNIILDNVKISSPSSFVVDESTVYLFILGESNLIVSSNDAGIQCSDSFIQIMNATSQEKIKNSLTVSSDKYAGIGGGSFNPSCKGIFIYGGRIIANGGEYGAGIGGGEGYEKTNSAGVHRIEIINGDVTSTGGKQGAGIGGGTGKSEFSSSVGIINIYGGKVQAIGGEYSAGIGGGYGSSKGSSSVNSIEISGGEVSAKGGSYGSGIGNGYSSNREASTVGTITLDTSRTIKNSIDKVAICTTIDATKGEKAKKAIGNGFLDDISAPNIIEKGTTISCQSDSSICSFSPSDKKCIKPWKCSSTDSENCPKCNLDNCEHSNVYCVCDLCKEGYKPKDEICVLANETDGGINGGNDCNPRIENCIEFLNGNCRICDKCAPGFKPSQDKSMCISCAVEDFRCRQYREQCLCEKCEAGFKPDPNDNFKCRACSVANCADCNGDFNVCNACVSGYKKTADQKCDACSQEETGSEPFSCALFAQNSCTCERCRSGYALDAGKCVRCSVEHCNDCPTSPSVCTSCASGFKVAASSQQQQPSNMSQGFVGGGSCEPCNVPSCIAYSIGCSCSACASGFMQQNGVCVESPNQVQPSTQQPSSPLPSQPAQKVAAVLFCASESMAAVCTEMAAGWSLQHHQKLTEFARMKMNDFSTGVTEKFGYAKMVDTLASVSIVYNASPENINSVLATVKKTRNIAVFQFGSMDPSHVYNFHHLSVKRASIQVFCVNGYLAETANNGEIPKMSFSGGDLTSLNSFSCFFGCIRFSSSVEMNKVLLVAVSIGDEVISIRSDVFLVDSHNIAITSKAKIQAKSFGVVLPETSSMCNSISVTFSENSLIVSTMAASENSIVLSSLIGKEQTMIVTSVKRVDMKIDPSKSVKTIKKLTNLSFKNDNSQPGFNSITVSFDQQSEWDKVNFKKGIVFEHQTSDQIYIQNQPKNIKVVVNKRNLNGQIEYGNGQNSKEARVSGLPDNAINAIILSFIMASFLLILSAFLFFRKKPKVVKRKSAKDSTTPLLNQVFNDGF